MFHDETIGLSRLHLLLYSLTNLYLLEHYKNQHEYNFMLMLIYFR